MSRADSMAVSKEQYWVVMKGLRSAAQMAASTADRMASQRAVRSVALSAGLTDTDLVLNLADHWAADSVVTKDGKLVGWTDQPMAVCLAVVMV